MKHVAFGGLFRHKTSRVNACSEIFVVMSSISRATFFFSVSTEKSRTGVFWWHWRQSMPTERLIRLISALSASGVMSFGKCFRFFPAPAAQTVVAVNARTREAAIRSFLMTNVPPYQRQVDTSRPTLALGAWVRECPIPRGLCVTAVSRADDDEV